jgi:transcriptional regulator with XRE-family HTH domain
MANINKFLSLVSETPSKWIEKANYREQNQEWLDISAEIAIKVLRELRAKSLTQKDLAEKMNVSPQYINKIVKGNENLSLETICKLEKALNISLVQIVNFAEKTRNTYVELELYSSILEEPSYETELIYSSEKIKETIEYQEGEFISFNINLLPKEVA